MRRVWTQPPSFSLQPKNKCHMHNYRVVMTPRTVYAMVVPTISLLGRAPPTTTVQVAQGAQGQVRGVGNNAFSNPAATRRNGQTHASNSYVSSSPRGAVTSAAVTESIQPEAYCVRERRRDGHVTQGMSERAQRVGAASSTGFSFPNLMDNTTVVRVVCNRSARGDWLI